MEEMDFLRKLIEEMEKAKCEEFEHISVTYRGAYFKFEIIGGGGRMEVVEFEHVFVKQWSMFIMFAYHLPDVLRCV